MRQGRFIYAARNESTGAIKIGASRWPSQRVKSLSWSARASVKIVGFCPGDMSKERELHRRFAASRLHGEWFSPTPEVIGFVESLSRYNGEEIPSRWAEQEKDMYKEICAEIFDRIEARALNIPISITALCIASGVASSTILRLRSGKKPRAQTLNKLYRKLDELEAK